MTVSLLPSEDIEILKTIFTKYSSDTEYGSKLAVLKPMYKL